jgi:hypothetical protein
MIRLTWLQFRTQTLTAAAALAAFAVLLAATGPHMASLYAASGLSSCRGGSCQNLAGYFEAQLQSTAIYPALYLISVVSILLAPALTGLFWGAPLIARELETGTSALTAMAVTEGLSLMQAWWAAPLGRAVSHPGRLCRAIDRREP